MVVKQLPDGRLDLTQMIRRTEEEMEKETPVICEASFSWEGLYCAVDLLRYCELDTFAMVKVWEKLRELAQ